MADKLKAAGLMVASVTGAVFLFDEFVWKDGFGTSAKDAGKDALAAALGALVYVFILDPLILKGGSAL